MMTALGAVKRMVRGTATDGVLSEIGSFGGQFTSPGAGQVLVASTDGVGTKLNVARMAGRHTTIGRDLVNHCVNDILVQGARPLFFLDYLGTSKLRADVFRDVVAGLCRGCRENGCALLGGETAEMPGLYPPEEYDLVGTIVGTVDRRRIVTGNSIRPGDVLIGLPSSGLHTNGYSLARKVVFEKAGLAVGDRFPGMRRTVADVLLDVHRSYLGPVTRLMETVKVRGMAHITGGGLVDNVPRVLPPGTTAVVEHGTWTVPAVFQFIAEQGGVEAGEMYRVFNMGVGFVVIVRPREAAKAIAALRDARARPFRLGHVDAGKGGVRFTG